MRQSRNYKETINDENNVENVLDIIDQKSEVSDEVQALLALKPILDKLHELLLKDENNIIKERIDFESMVQNLNNAWKQLANAVGTIVEKIDSINGHIDGFAASTKQKMQLTVKVSDNGMKAINQIYDNKIKELKLLHEKQLEQIKKEYDNWSTQAYQRANKINSELHDKLKHTDGLYLTGFWYWFCGLFFWLGVILSIVFICQITK